MLQLTSRLVSVFEFRFMPRPPIWWEAKRITKNISILQPFSWVHWMCDFRVGDIPFFACMFHRGGLIRFWPSRSESSTMMKKNEGLKRFHSALLTVVVRWQHEAFPTSFIVFTFRNGVAKGHKQKQIFGLVIENMHSISMSESHLNEMGVVETVKCSLITMVNLNTTAPKHPLPSSIPTLFTCEIRWCGISLESEKIALKLNFELRPDWLLEVDKTIGESALNWN